MRFLLMAVALGSALAADPDPREIVRRSVASDGGPNVELALQYNYHEHIRIKNLDGAGLARTSKTHDVVMIDATPYRLLIEENGRQVSPEERREQVLELQRAVEARRQETPAQRAERLLEFQKRRDRFRRAIQEIPDAFVFRLVGEENINSRPAYVIEASPRPGYRPVDRQSKLFTQLKAKLWIDRAEYQWVRLEADLLDTVTFGWILVRIHRGSRVAMSQIRMGDGAWVTERMWYQVSMRIGLFKSSHQETEVLYSDYVRANSDPRLVRIR